MAQVNQYGSLRVTNGLQSNGGKDASNIDPLAADLEFDGQKYTIGPNDSVTIPIAGAANVSASGGRVKFNNTTANKKNPSDFYPGL